MYWQKVEGMCRPYTTYCPKMLQISDNRDNLKKKQPAAIQQKTDRIPSLIHPHPWLDPLITV